MSECYLSPEFLAKYPDPFYAIFMSSLETTADQTDTYISSAHDGYLTELEKIGQGSSAPGTHKLNNASNDPYSTRLRPVTNLDPIYNAQAVFIESIEFYGYDVTLEGSSSQDATTLAAIAASKSTNDAYALSNFRNALIMNWQPNGCRPEVFIDRDNILRGFSGSAFGDHNNLGDLSIGIPLNRCFPVLKEVRKVSNISVYGQLWQKIGSIYQRYGLLCMVSLRLGFTNKAI